MGQRPGPRALPSWQVGCSGLFCPYWDQGETQEQNCNLVQLSSRMFRTLPGTEEVHTGEVNGSGGGGPWLLFSSPLPAASPRVLIVPNPSQPTVLPRELRRIRRPWLSGAEWRGCGSLGDKARCPSPLNLSASSTKSVNIPCNSQGCLWAFCGGRLRKGNHRNGPQARDRKNWRAACPRDSAAHAATHRLCVAVHVLFLVGIQQLL